MKKVNIIVGKRTKKGVNKAFGGISSIWNKLEKISMTKKPKKR